MISSTSNQQIKNLVLLQTKSKAREKQNAFVIEGIKMFEEVRSQSKDSLIKTYVAESFYHEVCLSTPNYFEGIDYEIVTDQVFKEISETMTPQGILAVVKKPSYNLESMVNKENATLMVLEDIRDPGNLGTIIRTAEGAGVTGIILSSSSVDIFNPKVIRSTMGAIYRVPFVYVDDIVAILEKLHEKGVSSYAAHLSATNFYDEIIYPKKTAMIIGNEANGIKEETAKIASEYIKIPMEGNVESLNAGVAAAILMYEVYRQRRKS